MKLQHFINENNFIDKLKNNTLFKIYLKDERNILWRGTNKKIQEYQIFKPRIDRKPKDTPLVLHEIWDSMLYKKFGWRVRSEGVFVTKNKTDVYEYGENAYIFIPIEPFKFVYSVSIADFYAEIYENSRFLKPYECRIVIDYVNGDMDKRDKAVEILNKMLNRYDDKDLRNAILSRNEISFKCNEYVLMNKKWFDRTLYDGI